MAEAPYLRLAPSSVRGWFGGRRLHATDALDARDGASLAEAGEALQRAFDGDDPAAAIAVLAGYDGRCTIVRFASAALGEGEGAGASAALGAHPTAEPAAVEQPTDGPLLDDAVWDLPGREFRAGVRATRDRIAAGDVYVLNLTARLTGRPVGLQAGGPAAEPPALFETLLARAGSDMSALLGGLPGATPWIASVSPERFLRVRTGEGGARLVETCPIKGTRPRSPDAAADAALAATLLADEKERAEHVMVVDLERNDIGVVCAPGTVHVDPLYEVVPTPYCHQLVSTVRGTLRDDATFAELLAATFPCGSVTGAPKVAAMRIIDELEVSPRGAYCGALLVAVEGDLDSSVLIRTLEGVSAEADAAAGESGEESGGPAGRASVARWGAGCGITYDSDPSAERLELLLKASPVLGDRSPAVALRETMRVVDGRVPLLERHLERLAAGGCGPSVLGRVRSAVESALARATSASRRLGVTVTPDGEVAAGVSDHRSTLEVEDGPVLVPVEISEAPALPVAAAKPASRRFWDRAHRRAELAGGHQALLHLPDGTLVDGSTANVWLVLAGRLATTPAPPAVAGVVRELVIDLAAEIGIVVEERPLTLADYEAAEEVALSNAVGGFVPVRGRGGPLTARVAAAVERALA